MGANRPLIINEPGLLRCSKCKELKSDREFYKRNGAAERRFRSYHCIVCDKLYSRDRGAVARLFEAMAKRAERGS